MRLFQTALFRALCAIATGVLLIMYNSNTMYWLAVTIGGLFLLSGIVSCGVYYYERGKSRKAQLTQTQVNEPTIDGESQDGSDTTEKNSGSSRHFFPIVGIGSAVLGLILILSPSSYIEMLRYALCAIIIIGSLSQIVTLIIASRLGKVGLFYWLLPVLLIIISTLVLLKPEWVANAKLQIVGWSLCLYGVSECLTALKTYLLRRTARKQLEEKQAEEQAKIVDAEVIEETTVSTESAESTTPMEDTSNATSTEDTALIVPNDNKE